MIEGTNAAELRSRIVNRAALMLGTALAGAALAVGGAGSAVADQPPNCTPADLAGVAAGVSAGMSAYLFTHPDVNAFFDGLQDKPREQLRDEVRNYAEANPQTAAELRGIRQPMLDYRARCGLPAPESDVMP